MNPIGMSQENSELMVEMHVSFKGHTLIRRCLRTLQFIIEERQKTLAGTDFDDSETLENTIKAIAALDGNSSFYLSPDGVRVPFKKGAA